MPSHKRQVKRIDRNFFYFSLALTVVGLVAVADASAPQALNTFNDQFYFIKQQAVWAVIGFIGMLLVSKINYKIWEKLATPIFIISLILLIVVLFPGVGSRVLGARRWIFIGPISIQPSEITKFSLCLIFAKMASERKKLKHFLLVLGLLCILVMMQPDLGTTLILAGIGFIQIFLSDVNVWAFLGSILLGGVASLLAILSSSYRRERLLTFLQQSQDPLGKSYHIRQILLSLGLGGFFGVGLGASRQKYLFLPEAATDSIFAVISEEVGFFGALILISLLLYFVIKIFKIAMNAPDKFSQVLVAGIGAWIGVQIFLNIGSMVALVPLTGVPLPFISYGGSSLSTILVSLGIILNITKYENTTKKR
jgi:cell division protein FtsW